ncbi:MAG TPA: DinB family protein [Actinomadura sp.]|jgi:hypothetical protein|nr:DinB family protein [Actinomadura sp.]
MRSMGGTDVDEAVAEMLRVLGPHTSSDWQVRAGGLDWSCWKTAAHTAHDLLAYAGQVAGRPATAYLPYDLRIQPDAPPQEVLQVVAACGNLLSSAIATADPDTRAWHWGPTDPTGFAALGVNETLMHTYDITQGLGIAWLPSEPSCAAVVHRLFPDAPAGDPVQVLLWATGRAELHGHPRQSPNWAVKAAIDQRASSRRDHHRP